MCVCLYGRVGAQAIAQKRLAIMLVSVPLVYLVALLAAWWLLALTWPAVMALVASLALFAWAHLMGAQPRMHRRTQTDRQREKESVHAHTGM
jgi:membrane protein implicated in regulation of membrane protease activity